MHLLRNGAESMSDIELEIPLRDYQVRALREIAQQEYQNAQETDKVVFSAILDYFEARDPQETTQQMVQEGIHVLEDHVRVLLDLVRTLLLSSSYDTTKIRVLLEYLFEQDIGKDLIKELYSRTNQSIIERFREEELQSTADLITANEELQMKLRVWEEKEGEIDQMKKSQEQAGKEKEKEFAQAMERVNHQLSELQEQQKKTVTWVNGLINWLKQNRNEAAIQEYVRKNPKPKGVI
jgi:hypothetical protein